MFVIIAYPRSGTHLLATLLNSHPDLRCYDEILMDRETMPLGKKDIKKLNKNEGCIMMYSQFLREAYEDKEFLDYISKANVIHLTRQNLDEHLESLFKKRNAKANKDEAKRVEKGISFFGRKVFENKFNKVFEITYEQICANKNVSEYENKELLKFLGVLPIKLTTKLKKGIDP
jgi:hypothetical protein